MSDVKCPYCGQEQEICHDDGYGYEEDTEHKQRCDGCGESFVFTTEISFSYEVFCRDEEHHSLEQAGRHAGLFRCNKCDFLGEIEGEQAGGE